MVKVQTVFVTLHAEEGRRFGDSSGRTGEGASVAVEDFRELAPSLVGAFGWFGDWQTLLLVSSGSGWLKSQALLVAFDSKESRRSSADNVRRVGRDLVEFRRRTSNSDKDVRKLGHHRRAAAVRLHLGKAVFRVGLCRLVDVEAGFELVDEKIGRRFGLNTANVERGTLDAVEDIQQLLPGFVAAVFRLILWQALL